MKFNNFIESNTLKKQVIKIIVCCHKQDFFVENEIYMPLHVGKANSHLDLKIQGDNIGDNISKKNGIYCELTGLYWAWKNLDADYIGLCHYRRYFSFKKPVLAIRVLKKIKYLVTNVSTYIFTPGINYPLYLWKLSVDNNNSLKTESDKFSRDLEQYINQHPDCTLLALKPVLLGNSRNDILFSMVSGKYHIETIRTIIRDHYAHIFPFYERTLVDNRLHYANMIIMKKNLFHEYAKFMFDILEQHLDYCIKDGWCKDISDKSIARLSGYLGELLTNSFILYYSYTKPESVTYLSLIQSK